jgi:hypothetical protein
MRRIALCATSSFPLGSPNPLSSECGPYPTTAPAGRATGTATVTTKAFDPGASAQPGEQVVVVHHDHVLADLVLPGRGAE